MIVSDLESEAIECLGRCTDALLYKKLTRAIEALSNRGNWDASQLYLDINVQADQETVILPREVLSPIKIVINNQPSFSRSRLFEFSLIGPGRKPLVGWQWMDQNSVPLMADLPSVGTKLTVQSATLFAIPYGGPPSPTTWNILFVGLDQNGNEVSETLTIDGSMAPVTTQHTYRVMRRVRKDPAPGRIQVFADNGDMVANYYGDEIEPRYRKIKITRKARQIHMLFKRVTMAVTGPDDYIPLDSADAIIFQLKANELAKNSLAGPSAEVQAYEKMALDRLNEEQNSRNAFAALADVDEAQPAQNLNINNRDSLIAADVIDEVFDLFGPIGLPKAFDRLTDCMELLSNKSLSWEANEGYIDLRVSRGGEITLPRYVWRPIKINLCGTPLRGRNRWFEFHLNGPGSGSTSCGHWDDVGEVVTIEDPECPFRLVAINDIDQDDGAKLTVYGYDADGKWIRTPNPDLDSDEEYVDGVIMTAAYANTLPDPQHPLFSRITRITRDETNGYQQLLAYSEDQDEPILVGYYYPDETEPKYSRIRLPHDTNTRTAWPANEIDHWVRMRYRKRDLKISSLTDPLHLNSRIAVVEGLRALRAAKDDAAKAEAYEARAVKYLVEAETARNPSAMFSIELGENFASPDQGQF
jgi:hypothetical protein